MTNRPRILALFIPTLIAVGLFFTLNWADNFSAREAQYAGMVDDMQPAQLLDAHAQGPVQAYSQGLETVIFDSTGNLQYTLRAERQTQFENRTSLLTQPQITLFDAGRPNWHISADYGRLERQQGIRGDATGGDREDDELITFIDNARVDAAVANSSTLSLQSSEFSLIPNSETLRSDKAVKIVEKGVSQTAVGFEADLANEALYFNKEIRGTYEPAR
jgi:LPS export ABC transporter protein LptC